MPTRACPEPAGRAEERVHRNTALWGGKGVAKALKAHALLYAARQGCRWVETSSLQVNQGMCAINCALGFQVVRRHLHAYEVPADPR